MTARRIAVFAASALIPLAGCGSPAATPHRTTSPHHVAMPMSTVAACRYLRADVVANGGTPDRAALRHVHRHAYEERVVVLAGDAAKQVGSGTPVAFWTLEGICSRHGVQLGG